MMERLEEQRRHSTLRSVSGGCLDDVESPRRRAAHHQAHHQSRSLRQAVELRTALALRLDEEIEKEKSRNVRTQTLATETVEKKVKARADDIIESLQFEQIKLRRQLENVKARLAEKERQVLEAQNQAETYQLELESVKNVSAAKRCETDPRLLLASAEAANVRQENIRLINCFREAEELKAAKDAEIIALRLRLSELELVRSNERRDHQSVERELQTMLLNRENQIVGLAEDLSRQKRHTADLEAGIEADLEECKSLAQREKEQMETKLYRQEQRMATVNEELQSSLNQVEELKETIVNKDKYIEQYKETILALEVELNSHSCTTTIEAYEDEMRKLRNKMARLIEQITFLEYDNKKSKEIWKENVKLRKTVMEWERGLLVGDKSAGVSLVNATTLVPTTATNDDDDDDDDDNDSADENTNGIFSSAGLTPIERALVTHYSAEPISKSPISARSTPSGRQTPDRNGRRTPQSNGQRTPDLNGGVWIKLRDGGELRIVSLSTKLTEDLAELCRASLIHSSKKLSSFFRTDAVSDSVTMTIRILNGDLYIDVSNDELNNKIRSSYPLIKFRDWLSQLQNS